MDFVWYYTRLLRLSFQKISCFLSTFLFIRLPPIIIEKRNKSQLWSLKTFPSLNIHSHGNSRPLSGYVCAGVQRDQLSVCCSNIKQDWSRPKHYFLFQSLTEIFYLKVLRLSKSCLGYSSSFPPFFLGLFFLVKSVNVFHVLFIAFYSIAI